MNRNLKVGIGCVIAMALIVVAAFAQSVSVSGSRVMRAARNETSATIGQVVALGTNEVYFATIGGVGGVGVTNLTAGKIPVASAGTNLIDGPFAVTAGTNVAGAVVETLYKLNATNDVQVNGVSVTAASILASGTVAKARGGLAADNSNGYSVSGTNGSLVGTFTSDGIAPTNSLKVPTGASVTTGSAGLIGFDTDALAASHGAFQYYDGTLLEWLVGIDQTATFTDGYVVGWDNTLKKFKLYAPGAGGSLTVKEVDGSPSVTATTLRFTNGTVTDDGGGQATVTIGTGAQTPLAQDVNGATYSITNLGTLQAASIESGGGTKTNGSLALYGDGTALAGASIVLTNNTTNIMRIWFTNNLVNGGLLKLTRQGSTTNYIAEPAVASTDFADPATTISAGSGMSGGGSLAASRTLTWAPSAFTGNVTLWDGSQASWTLTYNVSGTDPVWTIGSSSVDLTTGTLKMGGNTVATVAGNIGAATATTAAADDSTTKVATTAYVQGELTAYASDTVPFTNKTLDSQATGNVLKFLDYKDFVYPHKVDGTGATITTNNYTSGLSGLATYAGTGGTNANYAWFRIGTVPNDLDTATAMVLKALAIRVSGTDTASASFSFCYFSPASSSGYSPSDFTAGSGYVAATTGTLTSPAVDDTFYLGDVTLTGWASGLTAGRPFIIGIARDGTDANNDSITVLGGTVLYGRTQ